MDKINDRRYYIAYGSNLNVPQMRYRCPGATIVGTANLKGWELLFKGSQTGSYLTIEEAEDGNVPVVIWEVTPEDEINLDGYEGFPRFYYKRELKVKVKGIRTGRIRTIKAFVYIMHEDRPLGIPSDFYLQTCREGYDTFYFDKRLLDAAVERSQSSPYGEYKSNINGFYEGFTQIIPPKKGKNHGSRRKNA